MQPIYSVNAEGKDITSLVGGRLLSLSVTDKAGLTSDTFEMLIDDTGDIIEPPRKGAKIRISMGYVETGITFMGTFTVDEVEVSITPQELRISGKAADMRQTLKSQKTRNFDDKTLKDIFGQIAADDGLKLSIDSEIGKTKVDYEPQTEESNLHLMTRLAERYGAIAKVGDGKLVVTKRGSAKSASGSAMPTIIITRQHIKKGRARLKDRSRYGSVSGTWHDQAKAKRQEIKETEGEGPSYSLRQTFQTEAEARAACRAKLAELQQREADLSFSTQGNPRLSAEAKLQLVGVSRKIDGDWIVTSVRHTIKGTGGFETQVEAETPGQRKDKGKK